MARQKALVLLQVIERGTRNAIFSIEERQFDREEWESDFYVEDRAKRLYLSEIEILTKHAPSKRKALSDRDWCIDATVV